MNTLIFTNRIKQTQILSTIKRFCLISTLLMGVFNSLVFAQSPPAGSPCGAHRWEKGDHWTGVGCAIGGGNAAPIKGIIGCGNPANTESNVQANTTYDPSVFHIDPVLHLTDCFEPRRNHDPNDPVVLTEPFVGQKITWFNFDVRPQAGTYFFQTISNDLVAWVLYSSENPTCSVNSEGISGDCMNLHKEACGINFTGGWDDQPFQTPNFNSATNLYLVVWKMDGTNSDDDQFHFEFKARYGCGTPILITCPDDMTVECTASILPADTGMPSLANGCSGNITYLDDPASVPSCTDYVITRTWSVDGNCASSCEQVITVTDHTAPVIGAAGADATINCPEQPVFTPPIATDDCGEALVKQVSDITTQGTCAGTYSRTKTWNASDFCGNYSESISQTITVQDMTAPIFISTPPALVELLCGESSDPSNTGFPIAEDACIGAVTPSYMDVHVSGGICGEATGGAFDRIWTAQDACGNVVKFMQRITCGPCITVCALTQGFYGSTNGKFNGKTAVELIQDALGQLDLGAGGGRLRVLNDDAAGCLNSLMPGGGAPKIFPSDLTLNSACSGIPANWTNNNGRFASVLWGQAVALWLNSKLFPEFNALALENACILIPDLLTNAGVTDVAGLLNYTSDILDGNPSLSNGQLGILAGYLGDIHDHFDECGLACDGFYKEVPPEENSGKPDVQENDFKIVPNPLQGEFIINLDEESVGKTASILIINQFGQVVLTETYASLLSENVHLWATTLQAGVYQIVVVVNSQRPMNKIMVVVKP